MDTGFSGFLSLPSSIITTLDLPWSASDIVTLGDGSETLFDLFTANVIWDGQYREIYIAELEMEPLLGMALLYGYRLQVDNVDILHQQMLELRMAQHVYYEVRNIVEANQQILTSNHFYAWMDHTYTTTMIVGIRRLVDPDDASITIGNPLLWGLAIKKLMKHLRFSVTYCSGTIIFSGL